MNARFRFSILGISFSFLSLWFLLSSGTPAWAAEQAAAASPKIAVVNLDQVFQEYEKTKTSDAKLEEMTNSKQADRDKLVAEIKNMRDELILLNQESRAERQKAIEEKLRGLASFDQQAKETLRKQREDTVKEILHDIETAVTSHAKEHGYDLVFNARAVLYQVDAVDITKDILTILNGHHEKKGH